MRPIHWIVISIFATTGCTSYFKRKTCEKVNWYDHGYKVAMSGKRLTGDAEYNACVKVDAEISHSDVDVGWKAGHKIYCSADGAYKKGQDGQLYNFQYCDAGKSAKTRGSYKKGIREFCQVKKAYSFGANGGVYLKVCPSDLADSWVPEYQRGRIIFLKGEILNKKQNISQIDSEISDLESQRSTLVRKINRLPRNQVATTKRTFDPATNTYVEKKQYGESEETKRQRQEINWQMDQVVSKVKNARSRQADIRKEIHAMEREMGSLK